MRTEQMLESLNREIENLENSLNRQYEIFYLTIQCFEESESKRNMTLEEYTEKAGKKIKDQVEEKKELYRIKQKLEELI